MAKNLSDKVAKSMFLKLLPMQMITVGVLSISSLLNSLLIGNMMSSEHLAVFGFMVPINCIHNMLGGGIAAGSQILCGRFIGCGDNKSIEKTYAAVSVLCISIGLMLSLFYTLFPVQIASLLGAEGNALEYTADYIRGFSWSVIFMMFSSAMIPFLQLNNAPKIMFGSIGVMTALNVLFDILSISVFRLGMFGIGLASVISYLGADAVILIYCLSPKCPIHFSLKDFQWSYVRNIFHIGLPNLSRPFCLAIRNWVFNTVAVSIGGTTAVTAMTITNNMGAIADTVNGGVDGSNNMVSSIFYGERDKESLRAVSLIVLKYGGLFQAAMYVLAFVVAKPFARLFGAEEEIVPFVAKTMRIVLLYLIANIYMDVPYNIYKGIGKTGLVSVITLVNFIVIPIPACLVFSKLIGIEGVYISQVIPEMIGFVGLVFYSAFKMHRFPKKYSEVTYIPESFGIGSGDRYDAVIRTLADIPQISQNAIDFCRAKNLDKRKSYYCGLCIEEMAAAILEHGSGQIRKDPAGYEIDLRMIFENDGISILLRDNYPRFNPMEWMRMHEPEDPMRYIGIRMTTKLAQEVNYSTALSLNVLSIRI